MADVHEVALCQPDIGGPEGRSLYTLHELLRKLESEVANAEDINFIKERIRATLPRVDTGRGFPQKKTPSGRTQVLHMNYTRSQANKSIQTEIEHLRFFSRTAKELGLQLEILTHEESREDIDTELKKDEYRALNYTVTESQQPLSKWAEDSVEYLENGNVAVPTPLFHEKLLERAMTAGRRQRWQGKVSHEHLTAALKDDHLWIPLGVRVNANEMGMAREHAAHVKGQCVSHIRAYVEGGNLITGEDATGIPVIIIGKDAISTTSYLYQMAYDEVREIICEDFGLETIDQVICVEQPGQFHLDMGMLFIGSGIVIVNDSNHALQDSMEMAEMVPCLTTETRAAKLKLQCELETAAAQDLEAAGIEVIRKKLADDVVYNFFNGEFVEGKDGFNYYITNGGPKDKEETFAALMVRDLKVVKKVFFSPQDAAQKSLQDLGGVGCRIKGAPKKNVGIL